MPRRGPYFPSTLASLILFAIAAAILLSLISYTPHDLEFVTYPPHKIYSNLVGAVGANLAFGLIFLFGYGAYLLPVYLVFCGIGKLGVVRSGGLARSGAVKTVSFLLLFFFFCSFLGIFFAGAQDVYRVGGFFGFFLSTFLRRYLGFWGAFLVLGVAIALLSWLLEGYFFVDVAVFLREQFRALCELWKERRARRQTKLAGAAKTKKKTTGLKIKPAALKSALPVTGPPEIKVYTPKTVAASSRTLDNASVSRRPAPTLEQPSKTFDPASYKLPTLDLLKVPPAVDARSAKENIAASIKNLEDTLSDFGVGAKVVSVQKGPVVTMYELQPYSGVKITHITSLADDIALAMKAAGVRIVAPIPGRGTVGIEIPNLKKHFVYLREVLEESKFQKSGSKLTLAIGKNVKGDPVVADLGDMPHLLIAGTTGSGKTVCVNSLVSSILFKAKPDEAKFILIDPKKVELAPYSGIPHLLHPIISSSKKAISALNWAVEEMESRYRILAQEGARNIDAYNKKEFRMPFIIIIVDELADLMIVARDKIETTIQRLAQLSRAVGIHLILATQRPSVDVITGVIKANFPARISFKVASKVDSRTVLDMMGAEKLLGKGDCIFIEPGAVTAIRAQSSYIDDEDITNFNDYLRAQGGPIYEQGILETQKKIETRLEGDELLDEAIKVVLTSRQASASLLQRRMRVGYTRAARLLDLMEQQGVVGPFCGSKAREILVDPDAYLKENKLI